MQSPQDRLAGLSAEKRQLLEALLRKKRAEAASSAAIPPRGDAPGPFPLSFSQERLWLLHQLEPHSAAYNVPVALRFDGELSVRALEEGLARIVERHEPLRTRFEVRDGAPGQVIAPAASARSLFLPIVDLGSLSPDRRDSESSRLAREEALRPFDLGRGPVFRSALLRLSRQEHVLLFTLHHIVSDGWSTGIFARELATGYTAALAGRPPGLPVLPIQYADFAIWQRRTLTGPALERHLDFWRDRLAGLEPVLELPADRPRPARRTPRGRVRPLALPAPLTRELQELSRRQGTTLFATLLAGFFALLYRQTYRQDLCVGTPVAGRRQVETEGLIGFFVNTLVVRADLSGDPSFQEHLRRVHEAVLDAQAHQDVPFERLVSELAPERSPTYTPVFQVLFALQNAPAGPLALPGLAVRPIETAQGTTKFDWTLVLGENGDRLAGGMEYSLDLFDGPTVDRALGQLAALLEGAVGAPGEPLSAAPLLGPSERHQLLREWSGAGEEPATSDTLHGRFERQARRTPGAPCATFRGESWTYGELNRRANHLARRLRELGVAPGALVGLCLERSLELLEGILGILKAGAAYVPLDPRYPRERLSFMIADAGLRVVVGSETTAADLPAGAETVLVDAHRDLLGRLPDGDLEPAIDGAGLAYVIYTSGSTGRPKGALVTHANVVRLFDATRPWCELGESDVWTLFHSYAFDFSVWEVWGALLYGGRLVVVPHEVSRAPDLFFELLAREGVTVLNQTPSAFAQLLRVDEERGPGGELEHLRLVIFGGEALDPSRLAPWFERHGDEKPLLVNMYGITETTVHVTWRPLRARDAEGGRRSSIGVPIPDLSVSALDPWLRAVPIGIPGELAVGGAGLAWGYLGRPELTAERFVPDPLSGRSGARLYRSGDLGRFLPPGELEYLGRIDHQVKIRGFRIELAEIQAALEEHPAVREAVVLPREHPGGERQLLAWVVPRPEGAPPAHELRAFLAGRLPDYMVPAAFLLLEALPLNANGKVDRKALLSQAVLGRDRELEFVAPRTEAERKLAGIWQEVLGVDRVGVTDNFFALGGDSILSIRVRSLAMERGIHFDLQDLFRAPTVAELAGAAGSPSEGEALALAPFALVSAEDRERMPDVVEDAYPPSLLQLGMLFHGERDPGSAAYHNVSRFVLRAPYQPAALATAVADLVRRHPVLRTSFDGVRFGEPLQLVHREARVSVETGDLRELPAADRERILEERFEAELNSRFDWSRPGLLRFWANALTGETFELGIAEHHAILDGWSVSVLLSELFDLYFAALEGRRPALPEPPDGVFRDFVALERRALGSEESRRFWREQLAGAAPLELPRWPGRPAASGPAVRKILLAVPAETEARLGRVADSAQVPLKSVLLAAHLRVLERLGGGPDAMTGLVSNGRPEVEGGDRSLGLFLNTVPLRLRLPEDTWSELARAAFQAELAAMPHRRVPLADLQSRFGAGRPLFEVTFNYTHFHVLANASGLEIVDAESFAATSFALAVHFSRSVGQGLVLELQYDAAELWRSQVQAWADLYLRALDDLSRHPERRWAEGPALSEPERQQAAFEWNDTGAPLRRACLHELVEEQADRAPDAVAVARGEAFLSYRELDLRADRLAHRLRSFGVGPDVLVGLCAERSPELVIGILAVLKAGGAYLPLAPEYPRERLALLLEDSGASVLLAQRRLARELPAGGIPVVPLDEDGAALPSAPIGGRPGSGAGPEALACVLYTSGSTGRPKGVLVSHGGLVNRLLWAQGAYPVTAADRVLHKASFSFDFSVWEVFGPLIAGAQAVLARPGGQGDAPYLAREIREREVTLVHFIPSMLQAFLAEEGLEGCASLRFLFSGGEALAPELERLCRSRVPAPLRNQYGPTEISIDTTDWVCREEDRALGFVPLGRPLANTAVHVLDRRFEPALPGVSGELLVGGAGVSRGYLRRPDLTAERFLPDPFSGVPGARLYRTGDRALRLPGGGLRFLGRVDLQVKVRGFRIEPGEVESALRADPRVRQAAVVARATAGGDLRLVAYVAGGPEAPAPEELRERLAASLPEFMVPGSFVVLPSLPLTPNGKLDRAALPEPGVEERPRRAVVAPRDGLELRLAQLWEELLEVRPVGIRDDFFALGGHSLLALRLMGGIERLFGRKIPLSALLEARTVEALARLLRREAEPAPRSPLVRLQAGGSRPALFLVHPVGGDVLCYLPLVRPGVLDGPAFGLQSPSPGMLPEPWTLEALAELYVAALREAQPAGPYLLAGWSMGGMVAFEMARQLEERGDDVALLVLIDASPPGQGPQGEDPRLELAAFAADLQGLADLENLGALPEATLDELLEMEEVRARLPPDVDAERLRELFAVFRANRRALGAYRPRRYGGRVTLVHAEATVSAFPAQDLRAWEGLAGAGAEVHVLPGDHYSLLKPSGAEVLAELLERCVQGALGARG